MAVKIGICDDDADDRAMLTSIIEETARMAGCEIELFVFETTAAMLQCPALDIVFLDILFGDSKEGLRAIRELRQQGSDAVVFFMSSLKAFSIAKVGFDYGVANYLTKPLCKTEASTLLKQALQTLTVTERPAARVIVRTKDGVQHIPSGDILYIETYGRKRRIVCAGASHLVTAPLQALFGQLPSGHFAYTHSGFIVNLACVDSYKGALITLVGGHGIPLSRTYRASFMEALANSLHKAAEKGA